MENDFDMLDIKEASAFLKCHPVTLTRKAVENKIPAYKRLNKWLFRREDLLKMFVPNDAMKKLDK